MKRFKWVDICRGIGILFVVLGHTVNPFLKYIYAFHMPLFFMISGYLYNKENSLKTTAKKSFVRYIIPYFLLCAINLIFEIAILLLNKEAVDIKKYVIGILYSRGTNDWLPNCGPLWFLTALFCAVMTYKIIDLLIKKEFAKNIAVVTVVLMGYTIYLLDAPKLVWNIDTALVAVGYLHIGFLTKKYNLPDKWEMCGAKKYGILLLLSIVGILAAYFNPVALVNFDSHKYGNLLLLIFGSIPISMVIMFFSRQTAPKFECRFFTFLGKHTVFIMGFDYFSAKIFKKICRIFFNIDFLFWDSGEALAWLVFFIGKMVVLIIGIMLWTFVINKIPNARIRKMLSY